MGKVRVSYRWLLQNIVGQSSEEIETEKDTTVRDLLGMIAGRHGDDVRVALLNSEGKLRPTARILVDKRNIDSLDGFETIIPVASEISVEVMAYPPEGG